LGLVNHVLIKLKDFNENEKMSRKNNQNSLRKRTKNEPQKLIYSFLIGLIAMFSFVYSLREYNNFTIISFKILILIFLLSGIIISSIFYLSREKESDKNVKLYDYFALKTITYGSIFCSIFFLSNKYLSTEKEYLVKSFILEKHKEYRNSPNYIITEIKGTEREINIHNYSFEEISEFNKIEIKMKKGFWGFQIIKEIKLTK
jgi:hypothetical protein